MLCIITISLLWLFKILFSPSSRRAARLLKLLFSLLCRHTSSSNHTSVLITTKDFTSTQMMQGYHYDIGFKLQQQWRRNPTLLCKILLRRMCSLQNASQKECANINNQLLEFGLRFDTRSPIWSITESLVEI